MRPETSSVADIARLWTVKRAGRRGGSLDGELALHAGLAVPGHRAEELVLPGLEVDVDLGDAAVLDDLPDLTYAVALDGDVVVDRGLVGRVDLELAGRSLGVGEQVGQRPSRIGRDLDLAALGLGGALGLRRADLGQRAGVLAALADRARDVGRDVARVLARHEVRGHLHPLAREGVDLRAAAG